MALELSELKFIVNDSDLKRASETIGELVTSVGKLDKAARDAAQTEATLARAAKDNAKANLDNAKSQDVRLKSTIAADKADNKLQLLLRRNLKLQKKLRKLQHGKQVFCKSKKTFLNFRLRVSLKVRLVFLHMVRLLV